MSDWMILALFVSVGAACYALTSCVEVLATAAVKVSENIARAVRYRWDLEFEVIDSPRAKRDREPPPPPTGEDKRMLAFDAWASNLEDPPEAAIMEHLRASYAIVVGVKRIADPARYARAVETLRSHKCPLPHP